MSLNRRASALAFLACILSVVTCTNPLEKHALRALRLKLATQLDNSVSGATLPIQPVVEIRDSADVLVTDTPTNVTASITDGPGKLSGTVTVQTVGGVASFTDLKIDGAGPQIMSFAANGMSSASSNSFIVAQAAGTIQTPTALALQTQPSGATTGVALTTQPVVQILDQDGLLIASGPASTLTVTASKLSGSGTLIGTVTIQASAGIASFTDLQIVGTGTHVLRFTTSAPALQVSSNAFAVAASPAGPATQLAIVAQPTTATSGVTFPTAPLVEVRDANGNTTSSTASVTVSLASGSGTLAGVTTVSAVNGLATFANLRINGAGPHTLAFTSAGLTGTTSSAITVVQTPASLSIEAQPTSETSGVVFDTQPIISILDAAGLQVESSTAPVTVTRTSGTGTLNGTMTVNAVGGVASFTDLSITGTGAHTLTFTAPGVGPKTSNPFTVSSSIGPATQLGISRQPSGAVTGVPFTVQPIVQIRDQNNSVVTGSTAAVTVTIASGSGTLSGTTTVNAVNGVVTFSNLTITGTGSHSLSFTSSGLTSATSVGFTVASSVGPASQLAITTQPSGATSGVAFTTQPVVQIRDANGNVVTGSSATVVASKASGSGTLGGTTSVNAVNGVATFTNLSITGSGPHTLTFASTGLTSATSNTITLASTATKLAVTTQPSSSAANGATFAQQPVVRLRDASNVNVNQSGVNVTVAIASGGGTLNGTKTVATDVNGVATFSGLSITGTSGNRTLGFSSTGLTGTTSSTISITAGPATQLSIATQPSASAPSGVAFAQQPVIRLRDVSGNAVSQSGVVVTAAIASGAGTLGGTVTATTDGTGSATFANLSIGGATGSHTIQFTATGLASVTSSTINVTGPATQLSVATAPSTSVVTGTTFATQPSIQLRDASNNAVFQTGVVISVAITAGGGTLGGTATASTNALGIATFLNLSITGTAGDRTLTFTAAGLTSASATVTVTDVPATNEPANFALISQREFAAKIEDGWQDTGASAFSIQNDPAAPRSDGKVGQAMFGAGFAAGSAPINVYRLVSGSVHQLYVGMWIKFSSNWQGQSAAINKILFIWIDGSPNVFLNAQGVGSGPLVPSINLQGNVGGAVRLAPNVVSNATFTRGVWHFWEVLLVANSVGQLNGSARWWLDGVLIGNHTGIGPARDASNRWEQVAWNPTWGGAGGTVTADMYQQIDFMRISGIP